MLVLAILHMSAHLGAASGWASHSPQRRNEPFRFHFLLFVALFVRMLISRRLHVDLCVQVLRCLAAACKRENAFIFLFTAFVLRMF